MVVKPSLLKVLETYRDEPELPRRDPEMPRDTITYSYPSYKQRGLYQRVKDFVKEHEHIIVDIVLLMPLYGVVVHG